MIPPHERTLIQVWWTDCTNVAGGWHDEDDLAEFATDGAWESSNTGWLVHEDDHCYVLAGRMTDDGKHVGLLERVPKAAVTRKRVLGKHSEFATGGVVPGYGGDSVPAFLDTGYVLPRDMAAVLSPHGCEVDESDAR